MRYAQRNIKHEFFQRGKGQDKKNKERSQRFEFSEVSLENHKVV